MSHDSCDAEGSQPFLARSAHSRRVPVDAGIDV